MVNITRKIVTMGKTIIFARISRSQELKPIFEFGKVPINISMGADITFKIMVM